MMRSRVGGRWLALVGVALLVGGVALYLTRRADEGTPATGGRPDDRLRVADDARLEVAAYWGPITESGNNFAHHWDELRNLRPARDRVTYTAAHFQALLPAEPVAPGELWKLGDEGLLTFLRQFHPGAGLKLSMNSEDSQRGGYGCVRARDDRWADMMFRAHAEFALTEGLYVPGQFAGRLVLDRSTGQVVYFRLYLPPSRVNLDMHWRMTADTEINGKVHRGLTRDLSDGGSVSRLELVGGDEAALRAAERLPGRAEEEVRAAFARRLYRFKEIAWVDFDRAAEEAKRTGKPLHVIAVDGTLDDESC